MKTKEKNNFIYTFLSVICLLALWEGAASFLSPFVLPGIGMTLAKILEILGDAAMLEMIMITSQRLLIGLFCGIAIGLITGIGMGKSKALRQFLHPPISILQIIPPISWLVLALIWFGFNGRPAIFILLISIIPLIAISVSEGYQNIDPNLLEMAAIYKFGPRKIFLHIIKPSIFPFFKSACISALGIAWKIVVMGEVLTTRNGIGGMIQTARLNIEPESVLAWSLITVFLYYLTKWLLEFLFYYGDYHDFSS